MHFSIPFPVHAYKRLRELPLFRPYSINQAFARIANNFVPPAWDCGVGASEEVSSAHSTPSRGGTDKKFEKKKSQKIKFEARIS